MLRREPRSPGSQISLCASTLDGRERTHPSPRQPTAVNIENRAVHVIRVRRGQKQATARDIVRPAPAAFRNPAQDRLVTLRVFAEETRVFGGNVTGGNG